MWTLFWDMHSGGDLKEPPYSLILIEAEQKNAELIFYNKFGHAASRVTCTCCGEDYSIYTGENLARLTAFHRNCEYRDGRYIERPRHGESKVFRYRTLNEFLLEPGVKVIPIEQIKPEDLAGEVPQQGYVWVD